MNKLFFAIVVFLNMNAASAALLYNQTSTTCSTLNATKTTAPWQNIYVTPAIEMTAGETVLIHGTLTTQSNAASTAIMNDLMILVTLNGNIVDRVTTNGAPYSVIPSIGSNNIGYSATFEPNMTLQQYRLFTASKSGVYVFELQSFAATSASTQDSMPACSSSYKYQLFVVNGSLQVTQVTTGSETVQLESWLDGYTIVNDQYPETSILGAKYTSINGAVSAHAEFEISTQEPSNSTGEIASALMLFNTTQGTAMCFPANLPAQFVSGKPTCLAVTRKETVIVNTATFYKHHEMIDMQGSIAANTGDVIKAHVEVAYMDGNAMLINVGCDQNTFGSNCPTTTPTANMILWEQ